MLHHSRIKSGEFVWNYAKMACAGVSSVLDVGWEEHLAKSVLFTSIWKYADVDTHDSARSAESLCWEVGGELGLDSARLSVWSSDSAVDVSMIRQHVWCKRDSPPDDSDSASVDLTLGLVDVGDSLKCQY